MSLFDEVLKMNDADAPEPASGRDLLLAKADDFTTGTSPKGGESRTLEVWVVLVLHAAGLIPTGRARAIVRGINENVLATLAGRNLTAGLRAEHYRSVLATRPEDFTPEQGDTLDALRADFEQTVAEFLDESSEPPTFPEPEPHPIP